MATTSVPHCWKYDVFVSFRGDDIRKNFMDHMFNDFKQKGIYAFRDDRELPKGDSISPHLYKAIEESRFLIVIFSKNYASSSWCLQELVKILECKQIECPRYEVQTVFYDVKPSVVRKQTDSYAEAFVKHQRSNRPEVDNWKEALSTAANLSGWDLQDMTNRYEYKFIDCISKDILKKLCDGPLHVGENLVGIDFHFNRLDLSCFVGSNKVNMIGICGISGIGKTTIAKAIYNLMYIHFEGGYFCEDVRKQQDLTQVQMQMIRKIIKTDMKISSVGEGIMVIKKMMSSKPILLVLDDVEDINHLEAQAGKRIIHRLYEEAAEKCEIVQGHPLAHTTSASFKLRWAKPPQQNILLDIACSFIGVNRDFAASVLDGCNFFADTNIQVLVDKSLITISGDMSLQMHDLIQAMAREIVREESNTPGNQSRLWVNPSEIYNILSEKKATQAVEIIDLLQMKSSQNFDIDGKAFAQLKNLRILKLSKNDAVNFSGRLEFLSNKLRLLYWYGCPFKLLPSDFYPENIVVINLSYSNIKHIWTTPKCFKSLKVMKLRYCCSLTTTPDFSEITNLEKLDLEGCVNLSTVHPSIGMLKKLIVLNLKDCTRVGSFPSNVEMDSLQILNLSGCLKVDKLPEALGRIKSLTELHVDKTAITELPSFVMLKSLNFSYCNLAQVPESIGGLSCLVELNLEGNNLLEVPESIGGLSCLRILHLGRNNFSSLPGSLSQLSHLEELYVDGCKMLEVLPELPHSLLYVYACDCTSLREVVGSYQVPHYRDDYFGNCPKLLKNDTIDSEGCIWKTRCLDSSISQGFIHQLSAFLGCMGLQTNRCEFFLQDSGYDSLNILYHGNSMPEWFTNTSMENQVKVELTSADWCYDNFRGFGTCVVFKCKKPLSIYKGYSLKNFDGAFIAEKYFPFEDLLVEEVIGTQDSYMIWLCYKRDIERWEEANNFVTFSFFEGSKDVEVKECGVRLICDEDLEKEADLSMLQCLPTPTTQHGGILRLYGEHISSWESVLKENGFTVTANSLHPGVINTNPARNDGELSTLT
ncbi:NB-ARC domains-containing protein [Tanacetum coccineum]